MFGLNIKNRVSIKAAMIVLVISVVGVFLITAAVSVNKVSAIAIYNSMPLIVDGSSLLTCDNNGCGSVNLTATTIGAASSIGFTLVIVQKKGTDDVAVGQSDIIETVGQAVVAKSVVSIAQPGSYVFKACLYDGITQKACGNEQSLSVAGSVFTISASVTPVGAISCNPQCQPFTIKIEAQDTQNSISSIILYDEKNVIKKAGVCKKGAPCILTYTDNIQTGGNYIFKAVATNGKKQTKDVSIPITIGKDELPKINSIEFAPTSTAELGEELKITVNATDDRGVKEIKLEYQKKENGGPMWFPVGDIKPCNDQKDCTPVWEKLKLSGIGTSENDQYGKYGKYMLRVTAVDNQKPQGQTKMDYMEFTLDDPLIATLKKLGIKDDYTIREIKQAQKNYGIPLQLENNPKRGLLPVAKMLLKNKLESENNHDPLISDPLIYIKDYITIYGAAQNKSVPANVSQSFMADKGALSKMESGEGFLVMPGLVKSNFAAVCGLIAAPFLTGGVFALPEIPMVVVAAGNALFFPDAKFSLLNWYKTFVNWLYMKLTTAVLPNTPIIKYAVSYTSPSKGMTGFCNTDVRFGMIKDESSVIVLAATLLSSNDLKSYTPETVGSYFKARQNGLINVDGRINKSPLDYQSLPDSIFDIVDKQFIVKLAKDQSVAITNFPAVDSSKKVISITVNKPTQYDAIISYFDGEIKKGVYKTMSDSLRGNSAVNLDTLQKDYDAITKIINTSK